LTFTLVLKHGFYLAAQEEFMMSDLSSDTKQAQTKTARTNELGLDGLEFIEFAAPDSTRLENLFAQLGMVKIGQHKRRNVTLYRQGRINFVINKEPNTFAAEFSSTHGPSICATGFRVLNAEKAHDLTVSRGAKSITKTGDQASHSFPAIFGIGNSAVYFVDRYSQEMHFDEDFDYLTQTTHPEGWGLEIIDHLTNNVPKGEMQKWCDFYRDIFDFEEVRYFDIQGKQTGLYSKVMRSPCEKITIPINEPTGQKSQIQEYLDEYHGPGIQHVALSTQNIVRSVSELRKQGIQFLDTPDTYYDEVASRVPNVQQDMGALKAARILCDGDEGGYLLQIFTQNLVGPIFLEIIERHNHAGFGEGNFQALFDAIERDQKRRGYL
jgi:4-hydroxyphenylpyruvate dioxygenase